VRPLVLASLASLAALLGCHAAGASFDDHTRSSIATEAEYFAFADLGTLPVAAKIEITRFGEPTGPVHYLDPRFYALHDEWYFFRLLNGQPIDGLDVAPVAGLSFDSIQAIYAYYREGRPLPLGLKWSSDMTRLYSKAYYDYALWGWCAEGTPRSSCPRKLGIATLKVWPERTVPAPRAAIWAFELEVPDEPDEAILTRFFQRIEPSLPPDVRPNLRWLAASSKPQLALMQAIRQGGGPYANRVFSIYDVVSPGETQGYTLGTTAGYLKRVPMGSVGKASLKPDDIVVLEDVPDALPPVAGIITSVPQTPQSHLALLAAARGTPNGSVVGAFDDPDLALLASEGHAVALDVGATQVRWHALTDAQESEWKNRVGKSTVKIEQISWQKAPYVVPLDQGSLGEMRASVPLIGGKCAGLMALASMKLIETPFAPTALTIRGEAEHRLPIDATITALLDDVEFAHDRYARYLLLEGQQAFQLAHVGDAEAMAWLAAFLNDRHSPTTTALLAAGGLRGLIGDAPLSPIYLAKIRDALEARFAPLASSQGLRFRSSSTAEDVEGFNGAGVYASYTGFLHPEAQSDKAAKKKTIERAIADVWASYWSFAAFEERANAGVPHGDGHMAVLVEPRFEDAIETANGVALLGIAREGDTTRLDLRVNVQLGAVSVTNPPAGTTTAPEIDRVTRDGTAAPKILRVQDSSERDPGAFVLSDDELLKMLGDLSPLAVAWLDDQGASLPAPEQPLSVLLDLEFRRVAEGWPALASGQKLPPRIVYKQVRTLGRRPWVDAAKIANAPVPRDVLAAASRVVEEHCTTKHFELTVTDVYTDPGVWLLDYATKPFSARAALKFLEGNEVGLPANLMLTGPHTLIHMYHPGMTPSRWTIVGLVQPPLGPSWGFDIFSADATGPWSIGSKAEKTGAKCTPMTLVESTGEWLVKFFP